MAVIVYKQTGEIQKRAYSSLLNLSMF